MSINHHKFYLCLLLSLFASGLSLALRAQEGHDDLNCPEFRSKVDTSYEATVYYRQGYTILEPGFNGNAATLADFLDFYGKALEQSKNDSTGVFKVSIIVSGASPEGNVKNNKMLGYKRGRNLAAYISERYPDAQFQFENRQEDYQGLRELVYERADTPDRLRVLDIIDNVPIWVFDKTGKIIDSRKRQLMNLSGGRTWYWMLENLYPELRYAKLRLEWDAPKPESEPEPEPVVIPEPEIEPEPEPIIEPEPIEPEPVAPVVLPKEKKPFYMMSRTNMLYDAAALPNIGLEFYLRNGWAIGANWNYSWWKNDRVHWYEQTYGGDIEVRYYFGRRPGENPFSRHHVSVYGQLMTYDMETGARGYQAAKWNWGGGIAYGYSLPVARRLSIDFSLNVGYIGGQYKEYLPIDNCYVWQVTKLRRWIGPTKIGITLNWLMGRGNVNPGFGKKQYDVEKEASWADGVAGESKAQNMKKKGGKK